MKQSLENKRQQLDKLNQDLDMINFVADIKSELYSVKYSVNYLNNYYSFPTIYVITAVDSSSITMLADINRLSTTLRLIPKLVWVIVEDSPNQTSKVKKFLSTLNMRNIVHLSVKSPEIKTNPGSYQRNLALKWLKEEYLASRIHKSGVVFFTQTDHSYDIRIFEEASLIFFLFSI